MGWPTTEHNSNLFPFPFGSIIYIRFINVRHLPRPTARSFLFKRTFSSHIRCRSGRTRKEHSNKNTTYGRILPHSFALDVQTSKWRRTKRWNMFSVAGDASAVIHRKLNTYFFCLAIKMEIKFHVHIERVFVRLQQMPTTAVDEMESLQIVRSTYCACLRAYEQFFSLPLFRDRLKDNCIKCIILPFL